MTKYDQESAIELAVAYNRISLIFHAILAPPLVAFVWLYLESKAGNIQPFVDDQSTIDLMSFSVPFLILGLIILAFFLFKKGLRTINPALELVIKARTYWQKSIVLYVVLEIGLVLSVLGYYLVQKDIFLAMYIVVLIFFSLYKPTLGRLANHLLLKGEGLNFVVNCRSIARGEEKDDSPVKF